MKDSVVVGNLKVKPGEIGFGTLDCASLRDSQPVAMPLIVVNGSGEGLTLWVQAAIHGQEIPGIEVIRRLTREEVDPKRLNGVIKAVPVANPYAFQASTPFAPSDNVDAHTVFPGDPAKSVSHRLAHLIYIEGILKSDYFIDLHSNHRPAIMFLPVPVCENGEVMRRTLGMAEAFGLPICEAKNVPGWPSARAQVEGRPAMVAELLYHGWIDPQSVDVGVRGMLNVLKHLGMRVFFCSVSPRLAEVRIMQMRIESTCSARCRYNKRRCTGRRRSVRLPTFPWATPAQSGRIPPP